MKDRLTANTTELPTAQMDSGRPWVPGTRSLAPWLATAALFIVAILSVTTVIVLAISDGQPTSDWKVKPSVLLAIFTGAINSALVYALQEGITISWWLNALSGSTIETLHTIWDHGNSLPSALCAGRKISRVAFASIVATLVIIDGPLVQRASTVIAKTISSNLQIHIPIAEQLPRGFTGVVWEPDLLSLDQNLALHQVIKNDRLRVPINSIAAAAAGCKGLCRGTVRAAGLVTECSSTVYNYDFSKSTEANPGLAFLVNYTVDNLDASRPPQINLTVMSTKMGADCSGEILSRHCSIRSATVSYPIEITDSTITLLRMNGTQVNIDPTYYDNGDFNATAGEGAGTLGGVADTLLNFYNSNATIFLYNTGDRTYSYVTDWEGLVAFDYFDLSSIDPDNPRASFNDSAPLTCQLSSWQDPTDNILDDLRSIMFRAALYVSESKDTHLIAMDGRYGPTNISYAQPFVALQERQLLAFHTDYGYLVGAVLLMFAAIAAIAPTLWGWWRLGRPVTMSPVEIAMAFQAPCMTDAQSFPLSNAVAEELVANLGEKKIQYGKVIVDYHSNISDQKTDELQQKTCLAMDIPERVHELTCKDTFNL
jgi:hypothetical protein